MVNDEKDEDEITGWISYKLPNVDTFVYVDSGIIVSIDTYEEFFYKSKNLIGIKENQLKDILGCDPSEIGKPILFEDGDIQTPLDYRHLGLQIFISNGIVTSASTIQNW